MYGSICTSTPCVCLLSTHLVNTEVSQAQYDGARHELSLGVGWWGEGSTSAGRDFACNKKKHRKKCDVSHTHSHVHISVCVCGTPNAHQRGTWLQAPAAVWEWIPSFSTRVQLPNYYASTQLLYGDTQPITIGHSFPSKHCDKF